LCLKSMIAITKNDYQVIEHKLEASPIGNCQFLSRGNWSAHNPPELSTYTLMHHKSGQKFDLAKFHPTHRAELSMAEDAFDEDRVILLQRVLITGANTPFYQYKILLNNGDIERIGMIDSGSSHFQVGFGLYGRHLVTLSKKELKIFDTVCGTEKKLKNGQIKGGYHLFCTDRQLVIWQRDGENVHEKKFSFSRPFPLLDNDKQ